jgi:hypothetical protein
MGIVMTAVTSILQRSVSPEPGEEVAVVAVVALICGSLVVFGTLAMLIRVLSRLMGVPVANRNISKQLSEQLAAPMIGGRALQQALNPPNSEMPGSVTEHTTRSFDHSAYREHLPRE